MEEPIFVSESAYGHDAYNYELLKAKGIQFIQQLTGAFWTDYNEHDPGVTILEQLVYAMTDLAYRTGMPIQDLLFDANPHNKIFFNPAEILTVNPITLHDYRRVLIDEIPELKNIWLVPILQEKSTLKGLYKLVADMQDSHSDVAYLTKKIRRVYAKYRSICEDMEEVIVQTPIKITIKASIELEAAAEPEGILAELFFKLNEYYNPEINFFSLGQVMEKGLKVDEIFSGPLLKHGFILDGDLQEMPTQVLLSDISRVMMQIDGVSSTKDIQLFADDKYFGSVLPLSEMESVRFILPTLTTDAPYPISFIKAGLAYTSIDHAKIARRFNELRAANKRVYRTEAYNFNTPQGKHWNLAEYYSVQNQFPMIYGISEEGVPYPADNMRKGQAKQLKGYLMLFEQILSNYLSQVAHLKDIFSPRTTTTQTYFHQTLDAVPNGKELYRQEYEEDIEDGLLMSKNAIPADYKLGLKEIMKQQDNFEERRNKFLDFFLAVHGETYESYQLSQKPFYKNAQAFAKYQLESKTKFLGSLAQLNKARARAMNYLDENLIDNYRSGLEEKLNILLNFNSHTKPSVGQIIGDVKAIPALVEDREDPIWIQATNLPQAGLSSELVEDRFDFIDENDLIDCSSENTDLLSNTTFANVLQYSTYFLREGSDIKKYLLGTKENETEVHVVFAEKDAYRYIGTFENETDAWKAIIQIGEILQERNDQDEKLFMVENILLRPDLTESKFGFFLLDDHGNRILKSAKRYTFEQRKQLIDSLEPYFFQNSNYSVEHKDNGNFEIHFTASIGSEEISLISIKDNISVQEIHEIAERLYKFVSNQTNIIAYQEKIAFYIQITDNDEPIEEDFFHYQISCILPNWTTRLHNPQFQSVANNILQENIPANVICHVYWLSIPAMQKFEQLYSQWLAALQEIHYPKQIEELLRNELTRFLSEKYAAIL